MQPTGVVINRESWLLLMEEPLYSVRFIDREGTQELAVVSRVEDLDWFIQAPLPLSLSLSTWQSPEQVWVVAIGYQLHPTFGGEQRGRVLSQSETGERRRNSAQAHPAG